MQCPNCGKEAINVNGKFVCLDCGIQVESPQADAASVTAPAAPAVSHMFTEPASTEVMSESPAVEPVVTPANPMDKPVENYYLESLANDATVGPGTYDFTLNDDSLAAASTSVTPVVEPAPVEAPSTTPIEAPKKAEPLADQAQAEPPTTFEEAFDALNKPAELLTSEAVAEPASTGLDSSPVTAPASGPAVISQTTAEPVVAPVEVPAATTEPTPAADVPVEIPIKTEPEKPDLNMDSAFVTTETPKQEPESYFQPTSVDITPTAQAASTPVSAPTGDFETFSAPSQVQSGPTIGELEGSKGPVEQLETVAPIAAPDQPTVTEPAPSIDELLDKYQATATPVSTLPKSSPTFDNVQPAAPITMPPAPSVTTAAPTEIPSVESVFGGKNEQINLNQTPTDTDFAAGNKGVNKKLIFIIAAVVVGALLIFGTVFAVIALNRNKNTGSNQNQSQTFTISEQVSKAMDAPGNTTVKFEEKFDFSKTEAAGDQGKRIQSTERAGTWKTNTDGDVSYNEGDGKQFLVYQEKDSKTYTKNGDKWESKEGFLVPEPVFAPIQTRGALFYLTKAETLTVEAKEAVNGESLSKIAVKPKVDFLYDALAAVAPDYANAEYESLNTDNLVITAWVNDQNMIKKVGVTGEVVVVSDLYRGTVGITATATYDFLPVAIERPIVLNEQKAPAIPAKQETVLPKKVEIVDARG